jgi:hypothetical protein
MNALEIIKKWENSTEHGTLAGMAPGLKDDMKEAYHSILTDYIPKPTRMYRRDWDMTHDIVDCIFALYPDAYIYQLPTTWEQKGKDDPGGLLVGFRALGGDGSDDVHILPDGSWSQWMSGDLDLNRLELLEKAIKAILEAYSGPDKSVPLVHPRFIVTPEEHKS